MTDDIQLVAAPRPCADHPALLPAADDGPVLIVVIIDPVLWSGGGRVRRAWYAASIRACAEAYEGALAVQVGDPRTSGSTLPACTTSRLTESCPPNSSPRRSAWEPALMGRDDESDARLDIELLQELAHVGLDGRW